MTQEITLGRAQDAVNACADLDELATVLNTVEQMVRDANRGEFGETDMDDERFELRVVIHLPLFGGDEIQGAYSWDATRRLDPDSNLGQVTRWVISPRGFDDE